LPIRSSNQKIRVGVIMESRLIQAKLPPLKSILRIVRSSNGLFGAALSDTILGFATSLASLTSVLDVDTPLQRINLELRHLDGPCPHLNNQRGLDYLVDIKEK
jgi:hypothetical protein